VIKVDVAIVGAGIAGMSLAYFLSRHGAGDVALIERESRPARHASGRSARTLVELDPIAVVQRLKIAGAKFLRTPPAGFCAAPLVEERGVLHLCDEARWDRLRELAPALREQGMEMHAVTSQEAFELAPVLDTRRFAGAAWLPHDGFIDVDALLAGYLDGARVNGTRLHTDCGVEAIRRAGEGFEVVAARHTFRCARVVNAAGAWAAEVASLAGASALRLIPYRRSIALCELGPGPRADRWPLVWNDADRVYFRELGGALLMCPLDEEACPPHDPTAPERVVHDGLARLAAMAPGLSLGNVQRSWAGLRTFAPDRVPVVGEDESLPGFFWLAGQGGCGIETSAVLGELAAELLAGAVASAFDPLPLAPTRF